MATAVNYKVLLNNGSIVTIPNVDPDRIQKDGAGLRLYNNEGGAIASFDDGQAKAHWPEAATIETPAEPGPTESTDTSETSGTTA